MQIDIAMYTDQDGFLRRQCPNCDRQFKWHHGPANAEAETQPPPPAYYCPLCGQPASHDAWYTEDQIAHIQATVQVAGEGFMEDIAKGFATGSGSGIKFEYRPPAGGRASMPAALTDPGDMQIVASPCHPWEPFKIPDGTDPPVHCIVCGEAFGL